MLTQIYCSNIFFTNSITLRFSGRFYTIDDAKLYKHEKDFGVAAIIEHRGTVIDFNVVVKYQAQGSTDTP